MEKDTESLNSQKEKLSHYTKGKNAGSEWGGLLQIIQNRITEKEGKVDDIKKTIQQLEGKISKESPKKVAPSPKEEQSSELNE